MPANSQRVYLDANVFIAFVAGEAGRASVVRSLFEEAQRDKIELITSVLSITEVAVDHYSGLGGGPFRIAATVGVLASV